MKYAYGAVLEALHLVRYRQIPWHKRPPSLLRCRRLDLSVPLPNDLQLTRDTTRQSGSLSCRTREEMKRRGWKRAGSRRTGNVSGRWITSAMR
jgi:hypothetical protein